MRRARGFTLIELMVVIVILGGLIGLVGLNVFNVQGRSERNLAAAQMSQFAGAVQAYRAVHRRLPTALTDLTQRTERSPEPFLTRVPKDPWGHAYEYRTEGGNAFSLRSLGVDGAADTDDDLRWPEPDE
jgi:general secretion pathway protein G